MAGGVIAKGGHGAVAIAGAKLHKAQGHGGRPSGARAF
jgi:hypothetical protein